MGYRNDSLDEHVFAPAPLWAPANLFSTLAGRSVSESLPSLASLEQSSLADERKWSRVALESQPWKSLSAVTARSIAARARRFESVPARMKANRTNLPEAVVV